MNEAPRGAAIYLLREDGAALLQHRDDNPEIPLSGLWVPPGGHVEPGETSEDCIRREFLEESGYTLGDVYVLTEFLDDHAEGFQPLWMTFFWSLYDGIASIVCNEGQALEFVSRDDAAIKNVPPYLIHLWDRLLEDRKSNQNV